jgi:hypothetical protein
MDPSKRHDEMVLICFVHWLARDYLCNVVGDTKRPGQYGQDTSDEGCTVDGRPAESADSTEALVRMLAAVGRNGLSATDIKAISNVVQRMVLVVAYRRVCHNPPMMLVTTCTHGQTGFLRLLRFRLCIRGVRKLFLKAVLMTGVASILTSPIPLACADRQLQHVFSTRRQIVGYSVIL